MGRIMNALAECRVGNNYDHTIASLLYSLVTICWQTRLISQKKCLDRLMADRPVKLFFKKMYRSIIDMDS